MIHGSRQNIYFSENPTSDCVIPEFGLMRYAGMPARAEHRSMDKHPVSQRLPRAFGRGEVQRLLQQIVDGQDRFAKQAWELFCQLGHQIDCQSEVIGKINDRLWALEHPQGRKR